MIVQYYHGRIPLEKMIDLCKTTQNGTSAFHIIKAAETLGFKATGLACDRETLTHTKVILPLIAHVTIEKSYYHYVVIYEINEKKKYFLIADPADKIKKITFHEFDLLFNQMILVFMPLGLLPEEGGDPSLKEMLISIIRKYRTDFTHFIILSLLFTFFSVASTFYVSYLIDGINIYASHSYIIFIFILFLLFNLLKNITNTFRNTLLIFIHQKIDFIMTSETFRFILALPYSYYHTRTVGDILSRMGDMQSIKDLIGKLVLTFSVDVLLTVVSGICLLLVSPLLFFIALVCLLFYILLGILYGPPLQKQMETYQKKKGEETMFMVESLSSFETVKGIHLEKKLSEKFQSKHLRQISIFGDIEKNINHMNAWKTIIEDLGYMIIFLVGSFLVIDQKITLGTLFTASALLPYFTEPIKQWVVNLAQYKEAKNALKRIDDIFIIKEDTGYIYSKIKGKIECRNLQYSYDEELVFEKINITIDKGIKVMLLGKSGSGKSTFLKLLMKYYPVDDGQLYIDDIELTMYNKQAIDRDIGYISQNESLFTDTLYNNLTLYQKVEEKLLHRIIQICELNTIIDQSPLGLYRMIEENGFNLSGGEKQKIVLARLLIKNFDVYLIDEGMNQMDLGTERKILKNIYRAYPGKTLIVVSHRVDNLDIFDQVIRFEKKDKIFSARKNESGKYVETKMSF